MSGNYNRKDHLYEKAKSEGYRSRAAYKLKELQTKYRLISPGSAVLDLGCWPGGWLQVAGELVGPAGTVVGIDLVALDKPEEITNKYPAVHFICGDIRDEQARNSAFTLAGGQFDVVISDMSPKLSGIAEVDRTAAVGLAEMALFVAQRTLKSGGALVIKVFKGNETEQFVKTLRPLFSNKIDRVELDSSRKTSNEFYLVARGFKSVPR